MTRDELMRKRKIILEGAYDKSIVKKGNHNVHSERHCCVCGRKLSSFIQLDNNYVSIYKHYKFVILEFKFSMCYYPDSCYKRVSKK